MSPCDRNAFSSAATWNASDGAHFVGERYLGIKIPPSNLKPDFLKQAQAFANELADRFVETSNGKAV